MKKAFEAVWEHGQIIPAESIHIHDHTRILIVILDEQQSESVPVPSWRKSKGKYRGKLSSVDEFMRRKQEEKRLER